MFSNDTIHFLDIFIYNDTTNSTLLPTMLPTASPSIGVTTLMPTQGSIHVVQEIIISPKRFNFIALMLGVAFLLTIVSVTITGTLTCCPRTLSTHSLFPITL